MTDAPVSADLSTDDHHHDTTGEATPLGIALFFALLIVIIAAITWGFITFGPWVLGVTAVATVPVIYIVLLLLTTGR